MKICIDNWKKMEYNIIVDRQLVRWQPIWLPEQMKGERQHGKTKNVKKSN